MKHLLIILLMAIPFVGFGFNPKITKIESTNDDRIEYYMVDDTLVVIPGDFTKFKKGIFEAPKDRFEAIKYFNMRGYKLEVGGALGIYDENMIDLCKDSIFPGERRLIKKDCFSVSNKEILRGKNRKTVDVDFVCGDFYLDHGENIGGFYVGENIQEVCEYLGLPRNLRFEAVIIVFDFGYGELVNIDDASPKYYELTESAKRMSDKDNPIRRNFFGLPNIYIPLLNGKISSIHLLGYEY